MTSQPEQPKPENFPVTVTAQYIKDFSFESPNAPQIFAPSQSAPEIQMNVNLQTRALAPNNYEVLLVLKLEAKVESKVAFIAELAYGGVFAVPQMAEEHLKLFLLVEAPRILFPFARAALTNAVRDGGFPYVMIQPVDFMALYLANKNNVGTMPAVGGSMKKFVFVLLLGALVGASAAYADPVPEYALDKDFTACMGGEDPAKDPQRRDYCNCVRDNMKSWTMEEYGQTAVEGSKAHAPQQEPAKLQAIAQACIDKVLH